MSWGKFSQYYKKRRENSAFFSILAGGVDAVTAVRYNKCNFI